MSELRVLLVIGTTSQKGSTRVVAKEAARLLADAGCAMDTFDYEKTRLPLFNPDSSWGRRNSPRSRPGSSGRMCWCCARRITTAA